MLLYPLCKVNFTYGGGDMKNRVEALRKQRKVTQEELADALEVSRQTISSLENGRYNPSIVLAFKIARFFGASIEQVFVYEGDDAQRTTGRGSITTSASSIWKEASHERDHSRQRPEQDLQALGKAAEA
jgi:putative transcriptional regulator